MRLSMVQPENRRFHMCEVRQLCVRNNKLRGKAVMNHYRLFVCCLLLLFLFSTLWGCSKQTNSVDWKMHGAWVSTDGTEMGRIDLTVKGDLFMDCEVGKSEEIELDIQWPDDFNIKSDGSKNYLAFRMTYGDNSAEEYIWCTGTGYDTEKNMSVGISFIIWPDEACIVFEVLGTEKRYLVASTDPNMDVQRLVNRYCACFAMQDGK